MHTILANSLIGVGSGFVKKVFEGEKTNTIHSNDGQENVSSFYKLSLENEIKSNFLAQKPVGQFWEIQKKENEFFLINKDTSESIKIESEQAFTVHSYYKLCQQKQSQSIIKT